jgi:endonuclease YncB( thermonuclease family)
MVLVLAAAACGAGSEVDGGLVGSDGWAVVRVVDGDTVHVQGPSGDVERVRLIGINAPESDECFGDEATAALVALLVDADVELVQDRSDRDRYGRLLRYLHADGQDVGEELVATGHAVANRYPPDTARAEIYERAQARAQRDERGLWSRAACGEPLVDDGVLRFSAIRFDAEGPDAENLNDEWVEIENAGSSDVDLTGWLVRDESTSNRYRFPDGFVLRAGARVTLRSGCGTDRGTDLHWCRSGSAVWNNDGDTAFLLDPAGNVVASRRG